MLALIDMVQFTFKKKMVCLKPLQTNPNLSFNTWQCCVKHSILKYEDIFSLLFFFICFLYFRKSYGLLEGCLPYIFTGMCTLFQRLSVNSENNSG